MLLYQFRMGTNPRRVIIYLAEKGLDVPRYEIDYKGGEHRSAEYLRINPAGRAPVLVTDDGAALTEAGAIMEYLEELNPQRPMIGTDPLSRAKVRALERVGNDLCVRSQAWLWNLTDAFLAKERQPSKHVADQVYRYVAELLDILDAHIGNSDFIAGDEPTIADFSAFAIFQTARERFDHPLGASHPNLERWYSSFRKRPSADY